MVDMMRQIHWAVVSLVMADWVTGILASVRLCLLALFSGEMVIDQVVKSAQYVDQSWTEIFSIHYRSTSVDGIMALNAEKKPP